MAGVPRAYHHGDLREALVAGSLELIAERGMRGFSVAEVARRAGVSPAAPYRHFADRDELLTAVARAVAEGIGARVRDRAAEVDDPVDKLSAAAGAYTEFMIEHRAGLHVVFDAELRRGRREELMDSSRALMDEFLGLAFAAAGEPREALELMEQLLAQAHGYARFHLDGIFAQHGYSAQLVVRKSVDAARMVIIGRRRSSTED